MVAKTTTSQWLIKCKKIHGDDYHYPIEEWGNYNSKTKIKIICPKHGVFEQSLSNHVHVTNPTKCPSCSPNRKPSLSERINQAIIVHGDKYDYSQWQCDISASTRVVTLCTICGNEWEHNVDNHVRGRGCPNCKSYFKKIDKLHSQAIVVNKKYEMCREYINDAKKLHVDKYDYSLIANVFNIKQLQPIICPEHGVFHSVFFNHVKKRSQCPTCMNEIMRNRHCFGFDYWVELLTEKHPEMTFEEHVDGSDTAKDTIIAKCDEHGKWETSIDSLRMGSSCPACKGYSQRYLYVNNVEGLCLKYGIAKNVDVRLSIQNKKNTLQMETLMIFEFGEYSKCRSCESAIKKRVKKVLSRTDLEDGWTETCSQYDIEIIIEEVLRYGGVKL